MSTFEIIALVIGGGLGAGIRYLVDGLVMRGRKNAFPAGILIVNVSGAFVLGLLTGLGPLLAPVWLTILGVGLLGGFTTFSTVSVETVLLAQRRRRDWAWVNVLGTFVLAAIAAGLGLMIGGLLPR
ncbi:fluoride efflux transporter CrcB [Microbacterium invictum]|uniref:Fluoride-specific ion channel FluC n=1 Tax=Microbacterium invictum TaxID=515415 RepID=A0AA40VMG8_9MICO|nr:MULTISPECIES: fluoride efflux transporter CrcB [Microbacterium]MBB4140444.1 CrcB protein [Microbacterium invictum]